MFTFFNCPASKGEDRVEKASDRVRCFIGDEDAF